MTADSAKPRNDIDEILTELKLAGDALTSGDVTSVNSVTTGLESLVERFKSMKSDPAVALDRAATLELRQKLTGLNEIAAHLHLVARGMLSIGQLAAGGYGPDGQVSASPSPMLRGEG